jgi:hypothetical protein
VVEPSSSRFLWFLIVASLAARGITSLAQGHVPCVLYLVSLPPVVVALLMSLQFAPACQAGSSGRPSAWRWLSSWLCWMSRVVSLDPVVRSLGLVSRCKFLFPTFHYCFVFLLYFFFVLELGAPLLVCL